MDKKLKSGYLIEISQNNIRPEYMIEAYQNNMWFPIGSTKNIKNGKAEITDIKRKSLEYRLAKMRIVKIQGTVVYEVEK